MDAHELQSFIWHVKNVERLHRNQTRADGMTPYITHPLDVAWRAATCGDFITVVASLYHDTVEDTMQTIKGVALDAGPKVAAIVGEVTEPHAPDVPREERKRLARERLANASWQAQTLKAADIGSNLADSAGLPLPRRQRCLRESRALLDVLLLADARVVAATRVVMSQVEVELKELDAAT